MAATGSGTEGFPMDKGPDRNSTEYTENDETIPFLRVLGVLRGNISVSLGMDGLPPTRE